MGHDVIESTDPSSEIPTADPTGADDVRESVQDGCFFVRGPQDGHEYLIVPFGAWCQERVLIDFLHAAGLPARAQDGSYPSIDLLAECGCHVSLLPPRGPALSASLGL